MAMKELYFSETMMENATILGAVALGSFLFGFMAARCCYNDVKRENFRSTSDIVKNTIAGGLLFSVPPLMAGKPFNAAAGVTFWTSAQLGFAASAYFNSSKSEVTVRNNRRIYQHPNV
jgi:hypothetical protein